jgi:NADH:ubiquinone oxidoreductase subunit 5 (subunit L)/multisubunit Na+/H+ antiporter MnhA subunit
VFIIGAVLTVIYLARLFMRIFLGEPDQSEAGTGTELMVREGSRLMVASVVLLAVLALALGLFINLPAGLAALIGRSL